MRFDELITDRAVREELGRRLERHRLERNMTQAEMAAAAGVGQATVQRAERGESMQTTSLIRLLRVLDLLGGLDAAIPESIELPIAELKRRGQRRRRARRSAASEPDTQPWRWDDQSPDAR